MNPHSEHLSDLHELVGLFYDDVEQLGRFTQVEAGQVPERPRRLLAHDEHMTVTVESHHGCPVRVDVLRRRVEPSHYCREILLRRESDNQVVQYGIVRLLLDALDPAARGEIESEQTPLGRVLIEHNVLRRVRLLALWRVEPAAELVKRLELAEGEAVFGRTALIYCNGEPAVELLEIVGNVPPGVVKGQ